MVRESLRYQAVRRFTVKRVSEESFEQEPEALRVALSKCIFFKNRVL